MLTMHALTVVLREQSENVVFNLNDSGSQRKSNLFYHFHYFLFPFFISIDSFLIWLEHFVGTVNDSGKWHRVVSDRLRR